MKMIQAIIFDCFGVIVGKGFYNTYRSAGGDPDEDKDFIEDTLNQSNYGLITEEEFGSRMADKLSLSLEQWTKVIIDSEARDEDLLRYIAELKSNYKTSVLSNSNKGILELKIGKDMLEQMFDDVIASAEVGMVKPDLEIFRLAAKRLAVEPSECIFIDDVVSFVTASSRVGMTGKVYVGLDDLKASMPKLLGA